MEERSKFEVTIGGKAYDVRAAFDVVNPATEEVIARAPDCGPEEVDAAVGAAKAAFPAWKKTPFEERAECVRKIASQLTDNADELMRLLTIEQGKPHNDASGEIAAAAYWCNSVASLELPIVTNEDSDDRRSVTTRVPIGVVAAIVPWNYPVLLAIWKIAPALLAGNTLVVKPSPYTPLTMLKLGELLRGLIPDGVFNVISGGDQLGPLITEHPGIDKVSFTGSTATGARVMASAAASLKHLTLELGGNDPAIVLPDVDIDEVAEKLFWAAFSNSGQICIAAKRVYVHRDVYEPLKKAIAKVASRVIVGDGSQQGVQLGPIQNRAQYERVKSLIEDSRASGHEFLVGGDIPERRGFFIPVTIVDNPPESSRVVQEEAFGPVLPLIKFDEIDEAVRRANDTIFGLGASVWSRDEAKAAEIAAELEAGTVWINEIQNLSPFASFAGHKKSGIGVENGLEGLLQYTNPQTVSLGKRKSDPAETA
ncbi:aldehyde dehydrogenase family protein [Sphingomonas agri]|uniref:aldehyde dehydrogenase family protein n=1 Tax=Sphingomonas agri TaxID=1813878 RepID=UPI00311DA0E6